MIDVMSPKFDKDFTQLKHIKYAFKFAQKLHY